eukprot:GILK01002570.1.p1 GENE.GILK01002570.1~~GILK01002570.1.p1  ORF type:complete len:797 (+),score=95.76 GILK01002570.1:97-2391(+)
MADIYLHNPRGSNNRNRERNENRNNANRLFDSQNNDKGGYAWAPPMYYYVGSVLPIEWTNQHSCGPNPNTYCEIVIQYACDADFHCGEAGMTGTCNSTLRDGTYSPTVDYSGTTGRGDTAAQVTAAGQNKQLTTTITQARKDSLFYGRHETYEYWKYCNDRKRNTNLYTADRQLNDNQGARSTRQNPNDNPHGFECPEERDYYPYWHPSPWRDIAILTNDVNRCDFYRKESQNVKPKNYCWVPTLTGSNKHPNQNDATTEDNCSKKGGIWKTIPAFGIAPPDCMEAPYTRDNHLGNMGEGNVASRYNWTIPNTVSGQCVLRVRYNISNYNYDSWGTTSQPDPLPIFDKAMQNSALDCQITRDPGASEATETPGQPDTGSTTTASSCTGNLQAIAQARGPLFDRPYVDFGLGNDSAKLSLAINTNQNGRTFQDRSYVFAIKAAPVGGTIYNLNVRGKRGNIVQAYPAVEYDFVPNELTVTKGDYVHFQWANSDFNVGRQPNNGEGQQNSDRHNIVEIPNRNTNFPLQLSKMSMLPSDKVATFALLQQDSILKSRTPDLCINSGPNALDPVNTDNLNALCTGLVSGEGCDLGFTVAGRANEQASPRNCGKLNAGDTYFDGGLVQVSNVGTFHYMSTRNNNFSNRSQKGSLTVLDVEALSLAAKVGIALGTIAGLVFIYLFMVWGARRYPKSTIGTCVLSINTFCVDVFCCKYCRRSNRRLSVAERGAASGERVNVGLGGAGVGLAAPLSGPRGSPQNSPPPPPYRV